MSELRLPDVLVVGPQRSGTSWLDQYLRSRGDLCLPDVTKETFFFDKYHDRGLKHYAGFFRCPPSVMRIEVAPTYFDNEAALNRIQACLDRPKIIVTLRNPVERTHSLYLLHVRTGRIHGSLREAIERRPRILTSSYYADHLRKWFEVFGRDNVLILFYDDLVADGDRWVVQISRFLGLPEIPVPDKLKSTIVGPTRRPYSKLLAAAGHAVISRMRKWKMYKLLRLGKSLGLKQVIDGPPVESTQSLTDDDRRYLMGALRDHIEALEKMLGRDLKQWKI